MMRAWGQWQKRDVEEARASLETLLDDEVSADRLAALAATLVPREFDPDDTRATMLFDADRALVLAQRAAEIDPQCLAAFRIQAWALASRGELLPALEAIGPKLFAAAKAEVPKAFFERLIRWGEAWLSESPAESPKIFQVQFWIGLCEFELGHEEAASDWLEKAWMGDPTDPARGLSLIALRRHLNQEIEAASILDGIATNMGNLSPPLSVIALEEQGRIAIQERDFQVAAGMVESLQSRFPQDPYSHLLAADLFGAQGQEERVLELLNRARSLALASQPSPGLRLYQVGRPTGMLLALEVADRQASFLESLGEEREAIAAQVWSSVRRSPGHGEESPISGPEGAVSEREWTNAREKAIEELWPGAVTFGPGPRVGTGKGASRVVDVDDDGRLDLLIFGEGLYLKQRSGKFRFREFEDEPWAWVDWNEDRRLDIVTRKEAALSVRSYEARGRFEEQARLDAKLPQDLLAISILDTDVSGDLDVLGIGEGLSCWYNFIGGSSSFDPLDLPGEDLRFLCSPPPSQYFVLSDLDHDGLIDVVVSQDPLFRGLRWEASRHRPEVQTLGDLGELDFLDPPKKVSSRLAAGDLNGDGAIDLLEWRTDVDSTASPLVAGINLGPPDYRFRWESLPIQSSASTRLEQIRLGDIDNDGDLDLVGIDPNQRVRLFISESGSFQEVTQVAGLADQRTQSLVLGDINDDGTLDLILDGGQILWNEGNQNSWVKIRLEPRSRNSTIGTRVTLQVNGVNQVRECALSHHDNWNEIVFGIGESRGPIRAAIHWGHGRDQFVRTLRANRVHVVKEPR